MTYPLLWDESDSVLTAYQVLGLPTSVFVDRQGRIQRIKIGAMTAEEIEDSLPEIMV